MGQPSLTYTATFDANLARHVGLAAAILYNLLLWTSQSEVVENYDPDGWFYFTAKRFEALTTYSANWFTKASDKLVEAGLVEKKRMFRHDHEGLACLHFRITNRDWKSAFSETALTQNVSGSHTKCDSNNIEEKKKKKAEITAKAGDSSAPAQLPFGAERSEKVSVRPNKKEGDPARRPYAVGRAVLKAWGYKTAKIGVPMANLIKSWLDSGFDEKDIIEAGQMMKKSGDSYWATATPIQMLTQNAMLWYQQHKTKDTLDNIPHIKVGDRYYEIEPVTGKPIREIKL